MDGDAVGDGYTGVDMSFFNIAKTSCKEVGGRTAGAMLLRLSVLPLEDKKEKLSPSSPEWGLGDMHGLAHSSQSYVRCALSETVFTPA